MSINTFDIRLEYMALESLLNEINEDQVMELEKLIVDSKADRQRFLITFNIKSLEEMPMSNFLSAYKALNAKIEKAKLAS